MTFPPLIPVGAMSYDVHAGIAVPLGRIGEGARLVIELHLQHRYLAEGDPGLVQGASHPGLIGRVERRAAAVADPEADDPREIDPALRDGACVAGELARLVCRFNDEPLHRHLLWRHRARLLPGRRGASWV